MLMGRIVFPLTQTRSFVLPLKCNYNDVNHNPTAMISYCLENTFLGVSFVVWNEASVMPEHIYYFKMTGISYQSVSDIIYNIRYETCCCDLTKYELIFHKHSGNKPVCPSC